jgi:hypothetical protein
MVTNTNNSVPGNSDGISQLISRVINRFDSNGDGQLSNTEFTQFLTGLLSGAGLGSTTAAGASATASTTQPVPTGQYRSMLAGFDARKIDNPSIPDANTSKYRAARIFQDYPPQPESLPAVVERLRAQGINARQTDHDKIDFGDGFGPIDVILNSRPGGGDAWQWLPVGL